MTETYTKKDDGKTVHANPIPPVRKSVLVGLTPAEAFRRFTERMNDWWPLSTHSIGQEKAVRVVFGSEVGDEIVEHLQDGSTCVWGRILEWEDGSRVVFTWHPGQDEQEEQQVSVTFAEKDGATEVELIHRGWEVYGDEAQATRNDYDSGWEGVLRLFQGG